MHFGYSEEHAADEPGPPKAQTAQKPIVSTNFQNPAVDELFGKSRPLKIEQIYLFVFRSRNPSGGTVTLSDQS
jgi:hypothetical protein